MIAAPPVSKLAMVWLLPMLVLASCSQSESLVASESRLSIISAVLEHQPDLEADWEKFVRDYPEERSVFDYVLDRRLCVNRHTSGNPEVHSDRPEMTESGAAPNPAQSTDAWIGKAPRLSLSQISLPKHLRWDTPLSLCPSGTLYLGNPRIEGDSARVPYTIECGGLCGGGGQFILRHVQFDWRVVEDEQWWVS